MAKLICLLCTTRTDAAVPTEIPEPPDLEETLGRANRWVPTRTQMALMLVASFSGVCSLAGFLFAAARLGVDVVGNRETYIIRHRSSMGPQLLDFGGVDHYPFLASALRGWPFAQLDGRLSSRLNLLQESFAQ